MVCAKFTNKNVNHFSFHLVSVTNVDCTRLFFQLQRNKGLRSCIVRYRKFSSRLPLPANNSMTCRWYFAIIAARNNSKFSKYHLLDNFEISRAVLLPSTTQYKSWITMSILGSHVTSWFSIIQNQRAIKVIILIRHKRG